MHRSQKQLNKGFTLIETLVAILILAMTIGALLTLTAGGFFSIRYSKNELVANNLLQESLEYIRNTRDSYVTEGLRWEDFLQTLSQRGCLVDDNAGGCMVNPYAVNPQERIVSCSRSCDPMLFFPDVGYYGYGTDPIFSSHDTLSYETTFVRTIHIKRSEIVDDGSQLIVTANMRWLNGTNNKNITQTMLLTKWNLQ